jgi:hypothetical protein
MTRSCISWYALGQYFSPAEEVRSMTNDLPLYRVKRNDKQVKGGTKVQITNQVTMFHFPVMFGTPVRRGQLDRNQTVEILADETKEALSKGIKFVYVRATMEGKQVEGYIPKSVINDFIFANSKNGFDTPLTGVSYGGDKWTVDANQRPISFPVKDKKAPCLRCGKSANLHKLYESEKISKICAEFAFDQSGDLLNELSPNIMKRGVMIGVLQTYKGQYIFGHSGNLEHGAFEKAVGRFCGQNRIRNFVVAHKLQGTDTFYFNARENVPFSEIQQLTGENNVVITDLHCAAPKLIQACYRCGDKPVFLSEKWLGDEHGSYEDLDTIKSCDTCRKFLPFMLCDADLS